MRLLSLLWLLSFFPFSLYGYQDCTFKIRINPVTETIRANDITLGQGDDISEDSISVNSLTFSGDTLTLDTLNNSNLSLVLSQSIVKKRVWRCNFQNSVNKDNVVVNYTLVATNGQQGGISNGNAFIPTTVKTDRLRFRRRRKRVLGDIEFILDLSDPRAKVSGSYSGVLTIEVYEN